MLLAGNLKKKKALSGKTLWIFLAAILLFSCTPIGARLWQWVGTTSDFWGNPESNSLLEIHLIDVGKADAILLRSKGHAALLDAGQAASADRIVDYLHRQGVERLDHLIMSHPDRDHIGGMPQVLREIPVAAFVQGPIPQTLLPSSQEYDDLQTELDTRSIPQVTLFPGENISLGPVQISAIGSGKTYDSTNNSSLILRLSCQGFTGLFCGDLEHDAEQDLILSGYDLHADFLKISHHGSRTSSSLRFLWEVSPAYAAISVGPDRNALPREEVLSRLERLNIAVYRTDTDGDIVFTYDGEKISVKTEK